MTGNISGFRWRSNMQQFREEQNIANLRVTPLIAETMQIF